ncbi:YwdI family protein [Peribacillus alkalitolerans]|uniref:YwdI family protein n=1 Tax=Peribacillus alkalitolerans TaxID=1550385 RepID=UPI0013D62652|nr:YwdI family protein [Peribacillus alkalitolerans]
MDVSYKQVLHKIEELLERAKSAQTIDESKGYVVAIQSMCELLTNQTSEVPSSKSSVNFNVPAVMSPSISSRPSGIQEKTVRMEDANGDSLFDF